MCFPGDRQEVNVVCFVAKGSVFYGKWQFNVVRLLVANSSLKVCVSF